MTISQPPMTDDADEHEEASALVTQPIAPESMPLILETIEALRPAVQRDGGDLELVDVVGSSVRIRLKGACVGCSLAAQTLGGVRRGLVKALNNPGIRVIPAV